MFPLYGASWDIGHVWHFTAAKSNTPSPTMVHNRSASTVVLTDLTAEQGSTWSLPVGLYGTETLSPAATSD